MVNNGLSLVTTCSIVATVEMPVCSMAISGTDWLEVATIFLAYFSGLWFGNIPRKYGLKYGTNVPPFSDPEIPIDL